jgi:hypothetical protein
MWNKGNRAKPDLFASNARKNVAFANAVVKLESKP